MAYTVQSQVGANMPGIQISGRPRPIAGQAYTGNYQQPMISNTVANANDPNNALYKYSALNPANAGHLNQYGSLIVGGHPAFQGGPVPAPVPQAPPMPQVNQLGLPAQAPGLGAQQPGFLGLPQQAGQVQGPGFGQGFGHWLGLLQSGQLGQLPPGLARKPMFQPNQQTGMVNQGTNLVGGM